MSTYQLRPATLDDAEALVRQRLGMFEDIGGTVDLAVIGGAFHQWITQMMPAGTYRAWVIEVSGGGIVAGGGITILPWPPGQMSITGRLAFAYNVYTDPDHRARGLGRRIMEAIHAWCRENGIDAVGLNASNQGARLYRSLGYQATAAPMMFLTVK